ncbi:uncharacterized protein NPIL_239891 [Nephila pilipes]|uniref:Uncharacterized protein n=1 Tax=Nephila pilipes TaxID=299642 RepID=A0A8X6NNA9_NEPPI|nr:uncharacterized protein NPIL_239891 [Nephila pilipes]
MWFQLLLPHQKSTLATPVGRDGKIYFRLVNIAALLSKNGIYSFAKRFQSVVVQGKDVFPFHKDYPIINKKIHLVSPNVVYNIVAAENVSLGFSFAKAFNTGSLWARCNSSVGCRPNTLTFFTSLLRAEKKPEIIPLPFPETIPEKRSAPLETVSEPSAPKPSS